MLGFYWQMTQWSQDELKDLAKKEKLEPETEGQLLFPVLHDPLGNLEMEPSRIKDSSSESSDMEEDDEDVED